MKITPSFIIILGVGISLILAAVFLSPVFLKQNNRNVGCTMEAKICPDGSAVGRTGPNCEFAQCPAPMVLVFGDQINFTINKEVVFNDGLKIVLKEINDSRCKPGVICVWAGEFSPVFTIMGGAVGNFQEELRLGTQTGKRVTRAGYVFELQDASETTATIIINKISTALWTSHPEAALQLLPDLPILGRFHKKFVRRSYG